MWLAGNALASTYAFSESASAETLVYATLVAELVSLALVITLIVRLTARQEQRAAGTRDLPTARVI
jgi:hypothetical protein